MATGEVVGLFAKDEKDAMCGDVRNDFVRDNPNMEERILYVICSMQRNVMQWPFSYGHVM